MAGRIMTRMTTDVDQFESLIENGLLAALVSLVTFVGVGVVASHGRCKRYGRRFLSKTTKSREGAHARVEEDIAVRAAAGTDR
jgi:hypothetical protein